MSAKLDQASKIRDEILSTEQTYNSSLNIFKTHYYDAIQKNTILVETNPQVRAFLEVAGKMIPIIDLSNKFLKEINAAKEDSGALAKVFIKYADFLPVYSDYLANYANLTKIMQSSQFKNDKTILEIGKSLQKAPGNLSATDYAIMPVQRAPRYKLLLEALIKQTPADDPAFPDLQEALKKVEKVAFNMNEFIRKAEANTLFQEAFSKGYNSKENQKIRTVSFTHDSDAFFRVSKIDPKKLKQSLEVCQLSAEVTAENGLMKNECKVSVTIDGVKINYQILKGDTENGVKESNTFKVRILDDIATMTPGQRAKAYQVAEQIGKSVIESAGKTIDDKFKVINPIKSPNPVALNSSALEVSTLQIRTAKVVQQLTAGPSFQTTMSSPSKKPLFAYNAKAAQSQLSRSSVNPTKVADNTPSLEEMAKKIEGAIKKFLGQSGSQNWQSNMSSDHQQILVKDKTKGTPIMTITEENEQNLFEFHEHPNISQSAAELAIRACESPIEITSINLKDIQCLAEATAKINQEKDTTEPPVELQISEETMQFLHAQNKELDKYPEIKKLMEEQAKQKQSSGLSPHNG